MHSLAFLAALFQLRRECSVESSIANIYILQLSPRPASNTLLSRAQSLFFAPPLSTPLKYSARLARPTPQALLHSLASGRVLVSLCASSERPAAAAAIDRSLLGTSAKRRLGVPAFRPAVYFLLLLTRALVFPGPLRVDSEPGPEIRDKLALPPPNAVWKRQASETVGLAAGESGQSSRGDTASLGRERTTTTRDDGDNDERRIGLSAGSRRSRSAVQLLPRRLDFETKAGGVFSQRF